MAIAAVSNPPTSWTSPVPTRFLIPSASFITRDSRIPVWVWSKNWIGSRSTCSSTDRRMSVMARCAAMPSTRTRANEVAAWTTAAPRMASAMGVSSSVRCSMKTWSTTYLELMGRTRPATRLISMITNPRSRRLR